MNILFAVETNDSQLSIDGRFIPLVIMFAVETGDSIGGRHVFPLTSGLPPLATDVLDGLICFNASPPTVMEAGSTHVGLTVTSEFLFR